MYTVIIVDDEPIIKKSLSKLIEMKFPHFRVVGYASDGMEALRLATVHLPDLIITDIRMPEMDGIELIRQIEGLEKEIITVVVSGYDEFEYAQLALRHGASDYLLKPIKPELFFQMLEKAENLLKNKPIMQQETREWLYRCKEYSETIVDQLWGANREESEQLLTSIMADMKQQQIQPIIIREFYLDLYQFIKSGIHTRIGQEMIHTDLEKGGSHTDLDDLLLSFCDWTVSIIGYIQQSRNWGNFSKIRQAMEYIDTRFSDTNLTLQEVAEHVGMSANYFSRQFKEEAGNSFIVYLTNLRMNKAKDLLGDQTLKTYEIAEMVGYNDYPHFTKTFKKFHKKSPKEFRSLLSK